MKIRKLEMFYGDIRKIFESASKNTGEKSGNLIFCSLAIKAEKFSFEKLLCEFAYKLCLSKQILLRSSGH